jgi:hypothetical protein
MSIYEFVREFGRVAPQVYMSEKNRTLVVVPAYPAEIIEQTSISSERLPGRPTGKIEDTITYQIIRREPAAVTNRPTEPFQGGAEHKPRSREVQETNDGHIEIKSQRFDNLVQFDCWCISNSEADELIEWLEKFLVKYTFYFKQMGIVEMWYWRGGRFTWGTTEEEAMVRWRNPLKVRSLTYFARTEVIWYINLDEIEQIIIALEVD